MVTGIETRSAIRLHAEGAGEQEDQADHQREGGRVLGMKRRSQHGREREAAAKIGAIVESAATDKESRLAPNRANAMPPAMKA